MAGSHKGSPDSTASRFSPQLNNPKNQVLRRQLIQRRRAIEPEYRQDAQTLVNKRITELIEVYNPKTVAVYIAIAGELSLEPLIDYLHHKQINIALPCIDIPQAGDMTFVLWNPQQTLNRGCLGLSQPEVNDANTVDAATLDMVIVPLLGFNGECYRIGWGKGYYDKYFAFKQKQRLEPPLLAGVGFACQQEDAIEVRDWDVKLNIVITENTVFG